MNLILEKLVSSVDRSRDSGQVYFLESGPDKRIKIGFTQHITAKRIRSLETGSPYRMKLLGVIRNKSRYVEKLIHAEFAADRLHGEWFTASSELVRFIETHAEPEKITKTLLRAKPKAASK